MRACTEARDACYGRCDRIPVPLSLGRNFRGGRLLRVCHPTPVQHSTTAALTVCTLCHIIPGITRIDNGVRLVYESSMHT